MHRALPIAVVLLAGTAQAALSLLYSSPSTLTLTIAVPLELAPGPEGSTTVNANKTGAKSHIEANSCDAGDDCNTTYINNTSSSSLRVRFTLLTHSNSGDCNPCRIWIERGATQETQIEVRLARSPRARVTGSRSRPLARLTAPGTSGGGRRRKGL